MARKYTSGGSRLRRQLRQMEPELRTEIGATMTSIGASIARDITASAPRDTGRLGEAAKYRVSRDSLGVSVGYTDKAGFKREWKRGGFEALFQEFGTRNMRAQPFIRKSFRKGVRDALNRIDAAVSKAIRQALQA